MHEVIAPCFQCKSENLLMIFSCFRNDQNESPWNLRDDKLCANVDELNDSFLDSDFDNGAIAEMFKEKYIYSDNNRKFDVLDEIRIARLKREFGQSQL